MFINCLRCDVCGGPVVELFPVEANTAFADREFAHIRANGFIELGAAHTQIDGRSAGTDEAGKDAFASGPGGRLRQFCRHKCSMPRVAAEDDGLDGHLGLGFALPDRRTVVRFDAVGDDVGALACSRRGIHTKAADASTVHRRVR